MTEEWLVRLANQIKEKERRGAEEASHGRRRIHLLTQKGPAVWKAFADSLEENVAHLKSLLEGDITLAEGPLSFSFDATTSKIILSKAAFPSVQFSAVPRFDQERADISYV